MQTLDLAAVRESNECWWQDVDLTCPFCKGEAYYECNGSDEQKKSRTGCEILSDRINEIQELCYEKCPEGDPEKGYNCVTCEFADDNFNPDDICDVCDETIECEECTEGHIEILWDTGYGVYVPYHSDREEMRKLACSNGFALIRWNDQDWLLMSMCGLDCTWKIHYTRWKITGNLALEDINSCLSSGGYVFLNQKKREELCEYFKNTLPSPEAHAIGYAYDMKKIDAIVAKTR